MGDGSSFFRHFKTEPIHCPVCQSRLDSVAHPVGQAPADHVPLGSFLFCIYCASLLISDQHGARLLTDAETAQFESVPEYVALLQAGRRVHARNPPPVP